MSFRILAFDTSTEVYSVALMVGNHIRESSRLIEYHREREILSIINNLLLDANITLQSLDCLVFSRGPGSFIGVRIGISLAQGLSLASHVPLVQVSSLEILAEGIWRFIGAKQVLSTINARSGELYFGCYYRQDNSRWLIKNDELILTPVDICKLVSKLHGQWALVGTGWNRYSILCSDDVLRIGVKKLLFPSARDMFPFAIISLNNSDLLSATQIEPVYLGQIKWGKLHN